MNAVKCPDCGMAAEVTARPWRPYGMETGETVYQVRCPSCGRLGGINVTGLNFANGKRRDDAEAMQIAVEKWSFGKR